MVAVGESLQEASQPPFICISNGGNTGGFFRGGFVQSCGPIPVGNDANSQNSYDKLV